MTEAAELEPFFKLCHALEPWLSQIVIVGGWAHRLYRLHELAQPLDYAPLMTLDTDVAVPKSLPVEQTNIAERLREQGFSESFLGDHHPPVTQYRLGSETEGFYAEFLTPLQGSGYKRDGTRDDTVRIAGVSSQKLRYLEILLEDPWTVSLDSLNMAQSKIATPVQIANPTSFIVQKLLIHDKRERDQLAKDVLYVHDTIELFGAKLEHLNALWQKSICLNLHRNHVSRAVDTIGILFSSVNDTVRDASQIARSAGRSISPEDLQAVCRVGLEQVLFHSKKTDSE